MGVLASRSIEGDFNVFDCRKCANNFERWIPEAVCPNNPVLVSCTWIYVIFSLNQPFLNLFEPHLRAILSSPTRRTRIKSLLSPKSIFKCRPCTHSTSKCSSNPYKTSPPLSNPSFCRTSAFDQMTVTLKRFSEKWARRRWVANVRCQGMIEVGMERSEFLRIRRTEWDARKSTQWG